MPIQATRPGGQNEMRTAADASERSDARIWGEFCSMLLHGGERVPSVNILVASRADVIGKAVEAPERRMRPVWHLRHCRSVHVWAARARHIHRVGKPHNEPYPH